DAGHRQASRRELAAQARDVDVHRPRLDEAVATPDCVEELFASEHAPGGSDEDGEQLELLGSQLDRPPLHAHLEAVSVDLQVAGLQLGRSLLPAAATGDRP